MIDIGEFQAELAEAQRRLHEANERMLQALNEQASMTRRYTAAAELNKRMLNVLAGVLEASPQSYCFDDCDLPECLWYQARAIIAEAALANEVPHV